MGLSMLIGLAAAFFVYSDAQKRGRSFFTSLLWAVGSAAMPIVIIPLYLVIGRKVNLADKRDADSDVIDIEATVVEDTVPCPMCGKKVGEDFLVCPYCSHTLKPTCKSCGQEVNRECKICPHCQAQINPK
jgi:RNA polymerase subunit RPABC4/transcription elongation factor Spt4